jgi:hypothetical protein
LHPDLADFVLEQVAQRLDELEPQVGRQPADVVVGLDLLGGLRLRGRRLDDVGIERAWVRKSIRPRFAASSSNTRMNSSPMILPFLLGVLDAGQPGENRCRASTITRFIPRSRSNGRPEQLRLLLAHQAVVDVDARQPVPDRAVDQRRGHRRIDATRQGADDLPVGAGRDRVPVDALSGSRRRSCR